MNPLRLTDRLTAEQVNQVRPVLASANVAVPHGPQAVFELLRAMTPMPLATFTDLSKQLEEVLGQGGHR